jgi:hypothetical protein
MSEFINFCGFCGIALKREEIAGELSGDYVNFVEKEIGNMTITFCPDCQNKVIEFIVGDMDKAIGRRIGLEGQEPIGWTKKARQKWKDQNREDDDGSGGVRPVLPP